MRSRAPLTDALPAPLRVPAGADSRSQPRSTRSPPAPVAVASASLTLPRPPTARLPETSPANPASTTRPSVAAVLWAGCRLAYSAHLAIHRPSPRPQCVTLIYAQELVLQIDHGCHTLPSGESGNPVRVHRGEQEGRHRAVGCSILIRGAHETRLLPGWLRAVAHSAHFASSTARCCCCCCCCLAGSAVSAVRLQRELTRQRLRFPAVWCDEPCPELLLLRASASEPTPRHRTSHQRGYRAQRRRPQQHRARPATTHGAHGTAAPAAVGRPTAVRFDRRRRRRLCLPPLLVPPGSRLRRPRARVCQRGGALDRALQPATSAGAERGLRRPFRRRTPLCLRRWRAIQSPGASSRSR